MQSDDKLLKALLIKLAERAALLGEGDSCAVQPRIEGQRVDNPIDVPGYDWEQVEYHMKLLRSRGLITSGGVADPNIGIWFAGLTESGRQTLRRIR
ncbi:MAG: hypothetical protein JSR91_07130 [Proteobacteria bacterium]|nr:hypothetical protein [Pseudomonadota bacterium]